MASAELIAKAKLARRIKTNAYDTQISDLLDAAFLDMGVAGVVIPSPADVLVETAAITYVGMRFGQPDDYAELRDAYNEQKAQLSMCTGYTDWGEADG